MWVSHDVGRTGECGESCEREETGDLAKTSDGRRNQNKSRNSNDAVRRKMVGQWRAWELGSWAVRTVINKLRGS